MPFHSPPPNERGANSKLIPLLRDHEAPAVKYKTGSRAHTECISTHLASQTENSWFSREALLRTNASKS